METRNNTIAIQSLAVETSSKVEGDSAVMTPLPDDPIGHFCGIYREGPSLTEVLLDERRKKIMKNKDRQDRCDNCGAAAAGYEGVNLSKGEERRFLCNRCFNEIMAKRAGLDFQHLSFDHITLKDWDNKRHTFHFQTRLLGDHVIIEALEIQDDEPKGYSFSICGDPEDDLFALFAQLVERLRRELERRHIEPGDLTRYQITDGNTLRGYITWDDDTDGRLPCLVVDGKELSWDEVGRMLMTYEGFHFKLEIFERSEER